MAGDIFDSLPALNKTFAYEDVEDQCRRAARAVLIRQGWNTALASVGEGQQLTPEQWAIVLDCATSYDRRLPDGQGDPEIPAVLRALAGQGGDDG